MKNTILKILVIFLFFLQIGSLLVYFKLFNDAFSSTEPNEHFLLNHLSVNLLLLCTLIISLFFVSLILFRTNPKAKEIIYENPNPVLKEVSEPKHKNLQDQKNMQALNEKKKQMLTELSKNLNAQANLENYTNQVLINISRQIDIFQGIFFVKSPVDGVFRKSGTYAYYSEDELPEFSEGIGLTGQVAENKKLLNLVNIPENYITVLSGLGKASPSNLIIFPVIFNQQTIGIIELASFIKFDSFVEQVLVEYSSTLGQIISEFNKSAINKEN
jgi:hypothetical protein